MKRQFIRNVYQTFEECVHVSSTQMCSQSTPIAKCAWQFQRSSISSPAQAVLVTTHVQYDGAIRYVLYNVRHTTATVHVSDTDRQQLVCCILVLLLQVHD